MTILNRQNSPLASQSGIGHSGTEVIFSGGMIQATKFSGQNPSKQAALLLKRAGDREAADERRKEQAEKLNEEVLRSLSRYLCFLIFYLQGNNHFRKGHLVKAISKYNGAVKIYGLRPTMMSNLAAAYLKLEQYAY